MRKQFYICLLLLCVIVYKSSSSVYGCETEWEEEPEEVQDMDPEAEKYTYKLVLPEDGFEWKKYGQKFRKNIGKFRSYFKCQKSNCMAKKRVEWAASDEARKANIKVVYKGIHNHFLASEDNSQGSSTSSSSSTANQYNLLTQILNLRKNSSS